jgi:hypothetical protein
MDLTNFKHYQDTIRNYRSTGELPDSLKMSVGPKGLSTWYAPFDYINQDARIVLCGITPGFKQADAALSAAAQSLQAGEDLLAAVKSAKETGSFAGAMRTNLALMLDHIGINQLLGVHSCSELFGTHRALVHYTSALRYPVFKNGENYSGDKDIVNEPYLWNQANERLQEEFAALPTAIWIPLGQSVLAVFEKLVANKSVERRRVLFGLPHASGANAERIKYFIGQKQRNALSNKVNPAIIDQRKSSILQQVRLLAAEGA